MKRPIGFVSLISLLVLAFTVPVNAQKKLTTSEAKEEPKQIKLDTEKQLSSRWSVLPKNW